MKQTIGYRIEKLRKSKGLSQRALAIYSQLSNSTISLIEADKRTPYGKTLENLAKTLNVTTDYILTGIENKNNNDITLTFKSELHEELFHQINLLNETQLSIVKDIINSLLKTNQVEGKESI